MASEYDGFAPWFDAWQGAFGAPYDDLVLPRVLALLAAHGAPPRRDDRPVRIADLGSGTGDLVLALARAGYAAVGVDRSAPMREVARRKAANAGLATPPVFVDGDLRTLALDPLADAAVSVYTVMNHLTGDGDLRRATAAVARSLVPGGLFVFELNLPAAYARFWTGEETVRVDGATIRRVHRTHGPVIEATITIRPDAGDPVEDRILQRPYDDAEVEAALRTAGMTPLAREPFDPFGGGEGPTKALWTTRRAG